VAIVRTTDPEGWIREKGEQLRVAAKVDGISIVRLREMIVGEQDTFVRRVGLFAAANCVLAAAVLISFCRKSAFSSTIAGTGEIVPDNRVAKVSLYLCLLIGGAAGMATVSVLQEWARGHLPEWWQRFGRDVLSVDWGIGGSIVLLNLLLIAASQASLRAFPLDRTVVSAELPRGVLVRCSLSAATTWAVAMGGACLLGAGGLSLWSISHAARDFAGQKSVIVNATAASAAAFRSQAAWWHDLAARLRRGRASRQVSVLGGLFLDGGVLESPFKAPDGSRVTQRGQLLAVSGDYFDILALPATLGRVLNDDDSLEGKRVLVVSETAAASYWPGGSPIGRRLVGSFGEYEVVGVVPDCRCAALDRPSDGQLYVPLATVPTPGILRVIVDYEHLPGPADFAYLAQTVAAFDGMILQTIAPVAERASDTVKKTRQT
jgi:hypothetical protein